MRPPTLTTCCTKISTIFCHLFYPPDLQPVFAASWLGAVVSCWQRAEVRRRPLRRLDDINLHQCCADNNNNNNQNGYPRDQSRRRYFAGGQYYAYGQGPYAQAAYYEAPVSALRSIAAVAFVVQFLHKPSLCRQCPLQRHS